MRGELERVVLGIDWFPRRRFAPGEVIVRQGDPAYTAYVIEAGDCEVTRDAMGTTQTLRRIGAGDVFGETAIFTDMVRTATVTAVDHVTAIEITRSAFEHRIGSDSWLGKFMRTLARRFREAERRSEVIGASAATSRVIETIEVHLHLAGTPVGDDRCEAAWTPIRETVARILSMDEMLVTEAVLGSSDLVLDPHRDVVSGPR
jgi:CRP-like cAMP-binding protein